jgi:hypothetical protein
MPEAASSPWVLRHPHTELSRARRRFGARNERAVDGHPGHPWGAGHGVALPEEAAVSTQNCVGAYRQREVPQLVHG